jgi:hypothetical protein
MNQPIQLTKVSVTEPVTMINAFTVPPPLPPGGPVPSTLD